MPIAPPNNDPQPPLHLAYAHGARGRSHAAASFDAALTHARSASEAPPEPLPTRAAIHTVKAGETLYGIANARLTASGNRADPGALMRYALQIAQANGIRDPNRIYAGQALDLTRGQPASSTPAASTLRPPASVDGRVQGGPTALWETRIVDDDPPDDADQYAFDIPDAIPMPAPALPAPLASDSPRTVPEAEAVHRSAIARYSEAAAAVAARPVEPGVSRPAGDGAEATEPVPDILYKGLVGKALDALPMDPSTRSGLQQAHAVIGSSFAGRSLAALTGIGGPLLTLAGLAWGIFAARKIAAEQPSDAPAPPQRPALTATRE